MDVKNNIIKIIKKNKNNKKSNNLLLDILDNINIQNGGDIYYYKYLKYKSKYKQLKKIS